MEDHRSHCPMNLALEIFGDKWSLLIVRDIMFEGKRHFREFLQSEEKIASNILTDRLNMLETEGIVTKSPDPAHKQKSIYRLTTKGIDLLPIFAEFAAWSIKHKPVDLERYKHAKSLAKASKDIQNDMKRKLSKEHL
jgi:DNA-binding HxlR family transcriptional regulator